MSVSWFVWNAPDWMLSYLIPAETLPMGAVHALFALCLVVSALAGHTMTAVLLQRGSTIGALAVLGSGALILGSLWALSLDRYMAVGTFIEFMNGQTVPLQQSEMMGVMNVVGAIQGLAAALLLSGIYTSGKRLRAR
jgi:hypothetical protein